MDKFLIIDKIISAVEQLIPEYIANPEDKKIYSGSTAICLILEDGQQFGKMFGADKNKTRNSFKIAWTKASQVWITGIKTGEYEKLVFNKQIDEHKYGISTPDLIGWEGGQPITLKDGTKLSVGFSGFRGISDLEIVDRAIENLKI
jgi:uncharacterized protein GlcG (DUF336 family)